MYDILGMNIRNVMESSYLWDIIKGNLNEYDIFALNCALNVEHGDSLYNLMLIRILPKKIEYEYKSDYSAINLSDVKICGGFNNPLQTAIGTSSNIYITNVGDSWSCGGTDNMAFPGSFSFREPINIINNPEHTCIYGPESSIKSYMTRIDSEVCDGITYQWVQSTNILIYGSNTEVEIKNYAISLGVNINGNNNQIVVEPNVGIKDVNIIGHNLKIYFKTNKIHEAINIIDNNKTIVM